VVALSTARLGVLALIVSTAAGVGAVGVEAQQRKLSGRGFGTLVVALEDAGTTTAVASIQLAVGKVVHRVTFAVPNGLSLTLGIIGRVGAAALRETA